jgi:hypothetical protein
MTLDPAVIAAVLTGITHAVLLASILAQIALIWLMIVGFDRPRAELLMRSCAAVAGALTYIAAKAMGISIPELLLLPIAMGGGYITGIVGSMLPSAGLGFLLSWWVCGCLSSWSRRRATIGMRALSMILVLTWFAFVDVYAATLTVTHGGGFSVLMPNVAFLLAALIHALVRYHPPAAGDEPATLPADQAERIIEAVRATGKKAAMP